MPPPRLRFDVTRLFAAQRAGKALRGIDRTERHLVRWAAGTTEFDVEWVRQHRGRLVGLTGGQTQSFLAAAAADWTMGQHGLTAPFRWLDNTRHRPLQPGAAVVFNTGHKGLEDCARTTPEGDRFVPFIHDLIPLTYPDTVSPAVVREAEARMAAVATTAAAAIVNSRATGDDLAAHIRKLGRYPPPATVAPLAPALPMRRAATRTPAEFVFLSSIDQRKNLSVLLDVWETLGAQPDGPRLVVIGRRHSDKAAARRLDARPAGVIECGALSDGDAADRLAGACALLAPSVTEGYGMPIVEAFSMGVPVIASDVPAHREVAPAGALFLAPDDQDGWTHAVETLSADRPARAALAEAIPRVPTWEDHAAIVADALRRAADDPARPPASPQI